MEVLGGDTKLTTTHTVNAVDGVFTFVLDDTSTRRACVKFEKALKYFNIVIEEGTLSIVGDFNRNTSAKISGTFISDKILELKRRQGPIFSARINSNKELRAELALCQEEGLSDSETEVRIAPFRAKSDSLTMEYYKAYDEMLEENKDNIYYLYESTTYMLNTVRENKALMDKIPAKLRDNGFYAFLERRLEALSKVDEGAMAPDFTTTTIDGEPFTLSSTRGKVVLLNAWAST